ncbi:MAG: SPASM domain-containing protein [Actinobacteria bacterium]|nr:SPASM domain-containing protein [Actinomycetota bacterium]
MFLTRRLVRYKEADGEIWLNALTGAVDRLSGEEVSLVDRTLSREGGQIDSPLLRQLKSRGYLYIDKAEEAAAFDRLVEEQRQDQGSRPTNLIICPTFSCNLRCVYCFQRLPHQRFSSKAMNLDSLSLALEAFQLIREKEPGRQYSLGLFGGEPLLLANHEVVRQVMEHAKSESLPLMIVSNGVSVPGFITILEEYADSIMAVQLTIDGPEDVHDARRPSAGRQGTFQDVAAAADLLLERGIKVVLRANVDRKNLGSLPELTGIVQDRGWAANPAFTCSLAPVKDHLGSGTIPNVTPDAELLTTLLDVYDENPETEVLFGFQGLQMLTPVAGLICGERTTSPRVYHCEANYGGYWVASPDGYLYACPESIGQPHLAIGRFEPELEIWDSARDEWAGRDIATLIRCSDCAVGPLCGGGCTYASLARDREERQPDCDPGLEEAIGVFLRRRVITSC